MRAQFQSPQARSMWTAMLCAAAVTAQFVGGKATRDALFLTALDVTALPTMLIATSVCSILAGGRLCAVEPQVCAVDARAGVVCRQRAPVPGRMAVPGERARDDGRRRLPARLRRGTAAGLGFLADRQRALRPAHRKEAVRPDCRRRHARRPVWRASGRAGRRLVRRAVHAAGARRAPGGRRRPGASAWGMAPRRGSIRLRQCPPSRTGLRVIADAPHLQYLVALVLLGTTGAALLDYLFKARAVETFGSGDGLLRFFALYYAATSLISFVLQTLASRAVLERFGLALTTSTPSIALLAGSIAGLVAPGFGSLLVARGGESIFRGSWFRAGYELFFTPIPVAEKRAAKSIIDVARRSAGRRRRRRAGAARHRVPPGRAVLRHHLDGDRQLARRHRRGQPAEPLVRPHARKQPGATGLAASTWRSPTTTRWR